MNKRVKVIYRKLGRQKIYGQADTYAEVDERLKGAKRLEIIIHESLHVIEPNMSEADVERISIRLTKTLWHEGYRLIDNHNSHALQDGSNL